VPIFDENGNPTVEYLSFVTTANNTGYTTVPGNSGSRTWTQTFQWNASQGGYNVTQAFASAENTLQAPMTPDIGQVQGSFAVGGAVVRNRAGATVPIPAYSLVQSTAAILGLTPPPQQSFLPPLSPQVSAIAANAGGRVLLSRYLPSPAAHAREMAALASRATRVVNRGSERTFVIAAADFETEVTVDLAKGVTRRTALLKNGRLVSETLSTYETLQGIQLLTAEELVTYEPNGRVQSRTERTYTD
jgi:hypothetical protein